MKQSLPKWIRVSVLVLSISLLVLLPSCDQEIDAPSTPPENITSKVLELGTRSAEVSSFLEDYALDEDDLHAILLDFAVGYNRVASLVNSVLYADLESTDRATMKKRVEAAITELDAFDAICKELEALGKSWDEALDTAYPIEERSAARTTLTRAETGDEWYARRLVEIMVDPDTQVRFNLEDISRKTGVGMKKLLYLMNQTNEQYKTNIDIVDEEEYEKEMHYLETVRDTAGNINATLALATPLGAFGAGAAAAAVGTAAGTSATTVVTTTAANAVGWINNAKKAYTVVENASAVISFTNGVVNLAVDQGDIPPTFKNVAEVNGYLGLLVGGIGGFTGSETADKFVAVIGTGPDLVTKYVAYKDGQVVVSDAPSLGTTPVSFETSGEDALVGVLPEGDYRIPDSIEEWDFPVFDWGDESEWEALYDDGVFATESFLTDLGIEFQTLLDNWTPNEKIVEVKVDSDDEDGMPDFLDDIEDLAVAPEDSDFSVQIFAEPTPDSEPHTFTLTAEPNEAFVFGTTFNWDFGDGSSDSSGNIATIEHTFLTEAAHASYTVTVTAKDPRGPFEAKATVIIPITSTLQQIIDSHTSELPINVSGGTYVESITLHEGLHLIGAGAGSTIIEGSISVHPNTIIEGLTIRGTDSEGGISVDFTTEESSEFSVIDIDIIDVTVENTPGTESAAIAIGKGDFPFVGTITNTLVQNNFTKGIYIALLEGTLSNNVVKNNSGIGIEINDAGDNCNISWNKISTSRGDGLTIYSLNGSVYNNTITGNDRGLVINTMYFGSSVWGNTIQENAVAGGLIIGDMMGGDVTGNDIIGNIRISDSGYSSYGGGLYIYRVFPGSVIEANTITSNTSNNGHGGGVFIRYLGYVEDNVGYDLSTGAIFRNNNVNSNIISGSYDGGGAYIEFIKNGLVLNNTFNNNTGSRNGGGLVVSTARGSIIGNQLTGNTSASRGGGLYISVLSDTGIVTSNTIEDNSVTSTTDYGFGGGLYIGQIFGSFDTNSISNNSLVTAGGKGKGGGSSINYIGVSGSFSNNSITNNSVDQIGGGVYLHSLDKVADFQGNSIIGNTAVQNGGGCYVATSFSGVYKLKDENSGISGNTLSSPIDGAKKDLWTPWSEDRLPEDTE